MRAVSTFTGQLYCTSYRGVRNGLYGVFKKILVEKYIGTQQLTSKGENALLLFLVALFHANWC